MRDVKNIIVPKNHCVILYDHLSYLFTEFISRIFHLVVKATNLLLMSHGINHERCQHALTVRAQIMLNFISFFKPQKGYQLRKKGSVWVSLIFVTYPPSSSYFLSCALARDARLSFKVTGKIITWYSSPTVQARLPPRPSSNRLRYKISVAILWL